MIAKFFCGLAVIFLVSCGTPQPPLTPEELHARREQAIFEERLRLEDQTRVRLGITEAEWIAMPAQKRFELRQEQERVEREYDATQQQSHQLDKQAEATAQIADAMREGHRQELYTNSAYGTVVSCQITGGSAKFRDKWFPLLPTHFTVAQGDKVSIGIRRREKQKESREIWVEFNTARELEFCRENDAQRSYKSCRKYSVNDAFKQPYKTALHVPSAVADATMVCEFAPGRQ